MPRPAIPGYHNREEIARNSAPQSLDEALRWFRNPEQIAVDYQRMKALVAGTLRYKYSHIAGIVVAKTYFAPSLQYIDNLSADPDKPDYQLIGGWVDPKKAGQFVNDYEKYMRLHLGNSYGQAGQNERLLKQLRLSAMNDMLASAIEPPHLLENYLGHVGVRLQPSLRSSILIAKLPETATVY